MNLKEKREKSKIFNVDDFQGFIRLRIMKWNEEILKFK